ncbi:Protein MAK10-like protein [Aphelenchoides fujianensis]|nr:Protein MAK10-like protein [Aphelenchoides fujianensis]
MAESARKRKEGGRSREWPTGRPLEFDRDITEEFLKATKELELGEMVMSDAIKLDEAMTAVELMDPKMDSGMVRADPSLGLENGLKSWPLEAEAVGHRVDFHRPNRWTKRSSQTFGCKTRS